MREYIKEWKRLMKAQPNIVVSASRKTVTPAIVDGQHATRSRPTIRRTIRPTTSPTRSTARWSRASPTGSATSSRSPIPASATASACWSSSEARLLDQLEFDEWLAMYTPECIYWVPATPAGGDPRREVAISFDDRRRMEDRIFRLRTGYAWSQAPKSRTVRMVSNVEVFAAGDDGARMVRSNFLISEFRPDGVRFLSGWCGHRFVEQDGRWLIAVRQVNLIDCDQNLRNPSIVI